MGRHSYNYGKCRYCDKQISGAGFARAAHNRMHVRQGLLLEVSEWTRTGNRIPGTSSFYPVEQWTPEAAARNAIYGFFPTYAACREYYGLPPV
jgi:hypothetical protein